VFTGPDSHESQCHHELQESHARSANMRMKSCKILKSISQWEHAICPPLPQKQLHLYFKNITKHTCHLNAGDFTTKHSLQDPQIHINTIVWSPPTHINLFNLAWKSCKIIKTAKISTKELHQLKACWYASLSLWIKCKLPLNEHTSITQLIQTQQNALQKTLTYLTRYKVK